MDTTYNAINCQTCHEPHGETVPSTNLHLVRTAASVTLQDGTVVTSAGLGTLCMNCHQSPQNAETYVTSTAGTAHYGPHHGAAANSCFSDRSIKSRIASRGVRWPSTISDICSVIGMST